jgi:hypothetical protein
VRPVDTATGLQDGSPAHLKHEIVKLSCTDEAIPQLALALGLDNVPAVLMERTGPGWHVEFVRPNQGVPRVEELLKQGVVEHR